MEYRKSKKKKKRNIEQNTEYGSNKEISRKLRKFQLRLKKIYIYIITKYHVNLN